MSPPLPHHLLDSTRLLRSALAGLVVALLAPGCIVEQGPECGPGTEEVDRACTPTYAEISCGPKTVERDGVCVAEEQATGVSCGPGTVAMEGECTPEPIESWCGSGRLRRGDQCVSVEAQKVLIPLLAGQRARVTQGRHGKFSHFDDSAYAIDFDLPTGTPIAAARSGVVVAAREDSQTGCGDSSCSRDANFIVIDHGDGTYARYLHLDHLGSEVEVGDEVCAGERIGLSGNTGFSTGPHLHFEVVDTHGDSLPIFFEDLAESTEGMAFPNLEFTVSSDARGGCVDTPKPSACGSESFLYRGVLVDGSFPCSGVETGRDYTLAGTSLSDQSAVVVATRTENSSDWTRRCLAVDGDGHFSATVSWPSGDNSHRGYLFVTPATYGGPDNCTNYRGWSSSIHVWFEN
jgi:murein DD-endopeptidase MepM/ murein hydrolase activator NlpD